jgi:hypothetical protein
MKNIQSKMNVINRHGQYFMKKARSGLREILEERLKALNNQWDRLQDHASARQKDLEQLVQDKADNEVLSGEDSSLNAIRNNTALLSSLYFNTENEVSGNIAPPAPFSLLRLHYTRKRLTTCQQDVFATGVYSTKLVNKLQQRCYFISCYKVVTRNLLTNC